MQPQYIPLTVFKTNEPPCDNVEMEPVGIALAQQAIEEGLVHGPPLPVEEQDNPFFSLEEVVIDEDLVQNVLNDGLLPTHSPYSQIFLELR